MAASGYTGVRQADLTQPQGNWIRVALPGTWYGVLPVCCSVNCFERGKMPFRMLLCLCKAAQMAKLRERVSCSIWDLSVLSSAHLLMWHLPLCSPTPADISTEQQTSVHHDNSNYRVQRAAIIIPAVLAAMMAILLCIKCCQANIAHSETPPAVEMSLASQRKPVVPIDSGTACDIPVIVIAPGEQVIWCWCSTRICRVSSGTCELSYRMRMAACLELAFLRDGGDPSNLIDKQGACSQWLSVSETCFILLANMDRSFILRWQSQTEV